MSRNIKISYFPVEFFEKLNTTIKEKKKIPLGVSANEFNLFYIFKYRIVIYVLDTA